MLVNRLTPEQKQDWKNYIEGWRRSGKSASEWCKENEIGYHKFLYWRTRFSQKEEKQNSMTTAFIELPEDKSNAAGITIEYKNLCIRLSKQFDHSTLQSLIVFLRRL